MITRRIARRWRILNFQRSLQSGSAIMSGMGVDAMRVMMRIGAEGIGGSARKSESGIAGY